jgi:hypothetical protein
MNNPRQRRNDEMIRQRWPMVWRVEQDLRRWIAKHPGADLTNVELPYTPEEEAQYEAEMKEAMEFAKRVQYLNEWLRVVPTEGSA